MKIRKNATLDCTYDPVFNPFSFIYKTFKNIARIRIWGIRKKTKNANLRINQIFLSDSERESECECGPKIRRIAIPNKYSSSRSKCVVTKIIFMKLIFLWDRKTNNIALLMVRQNSNWHKKVKTIPRAFKTI